MRPLRIAIAGLGFMGATHARAIRALDCVQLTAVVSSDEQKLTGDLRSAAGNLGIVGESMDFSQVRKFRRLDDALADPEIDAIDICLPTDLHASAAIAALRAGKHVLVEKPLALDEPSALEVVREAEIQNRILMTGHVVRFLTPYAESARLLQTGVLGKVQMAVFRRQCARPSWGGWLTDPRRSGGAVFDLMIHDVDFALALFGPPAAIYAAGSGDLIAAAFEYAETGPVVIEGGWHQTGLLPFSMAFTIAGEAGTLEFSSAGYPLTLARAGAAALEPVNVPEKNGFEEEIRYFAECVASNRTPERCPPSASAAAVGLARRMLQVRGKGHSG